ncbi:MAG: tetratricopeptide repeat protein, partial [Terracidiphilus sp.]
MARVADEFHRLQQRLAERASEPAEAKLSELLGAGDFEGALRLKSEEIKFRREKAKELPRKLFELGIIHELRFDFPEALAAYREAWQLGRTAEFGFKYSSLAQRQNRLSEAIGVYEALCEMQMDEPSRATTLNNLAILYRNTQRMKEAEQAYAEALATYRKLAEANPDAYLPDVGMTLNNLANLYSNTQRMKEAEQAYAEALALRRKLAEANPDAYLPDVAMTLNNLANLYSDTQRMKEAEQAYVEALDLRRKLTEANPEAYLPDVAATLNNLAILYR